MYRPRQIKRHMATALVLLTAVATGRAEWIVIEVPPQTGWSGGSELTDINDAGEACGMGNYVINQSSTAIRFDGTTVTELPHLVPDNPITLVTGINNAGVICGYSHNIEGDSQAVYYEGTALHTIPYPPEANPDSDFRAYDINDNLVIVGYFWSLTGERTAFYYYDGVSYSLDAPIRAAGLYGIQIATGVNNLDVICGSADDVLGFQNVWTFDIATQTLTVLGRAGDENSGARDINAAGQTIGRARLVPGDKYRAVTFDGEWAVVDPEIDESQWGRALNDAGRMVGYANTSSNRWAWYADSPGAGSMIPFAVPDWTELTLNDINNNDWVVGFGENASSGGDDRGCLIKPPPGDSDHDGFVRVVDLAEMLSCLSGPTGGPEPPTGDCQETFDLAPSGGDGAVDLRDVAAFGLIFEGEPS